MTTRLKKEAKKSLRSFLSLKKNQKIGGEHTKLWFWCSPLLLRFYIRCTFIKGFYTLPSIRSSYEEHNIYYTMNHFDKKRYEKKHSTECFISYVSAFGVFLPIFSLWLIEIVEFALPLPYGSFPI